MTIYVIVLYLPLVFGQVAWASSVDLDQMPQTAASDKGLHCLPLIQQFLTDQQVVKFNCSKDIVIWRPL